ncbi:MAG: efflux RND transporter periplasmic adaptor subunit [Chitinophagaceae bacterium]
MIKRIFIGSCMWMTILCSTGCHSDKTDDTETSVKYTVTNPLKVDTSLVKDYVSQIKSVRNIEIRAQEQGFLQKIYVDEGQYVKAGQLLFRIMPQVYEAELQKSQAEAQSSEIELKNTQSLADKNIVSASELALAKAKLNEARADTKLAQIHLSFTEIRAPFSGTIDRLPLKLGSLVDEGALLTTLSDNSQVFAYFNMSEPEYLNYRANEQKNGKQSADLILANGDLLGKKGVVETVEGQFDNETGNIAFRARFPNPNGWLKNGETGKVRMLAHIKNALMIPQKSTYELQDRKYVYVVDKSNTVKSRLITVGAELPNVYLVTGGLSPEDKILFDGVQAAKEDQSIKYDYLQPQQAIQSLKLKAE